MQRLTDSIWKFLKKNLKSIYLFIFWKKKKEKKNYIFLSSLCCINYVFLTLSINYLNLHFCSVFRGEPLPRDAL